MAVDVARFFAYLETNGWILVEDVGRADLILVACCGVHQGAEDSGFASLAHVDKRRKAGSTLVAVGCLPGICEERLLRTFDVYAVPPTKAELLDEIIQARVPFADIPEVQDREPLVRQADLNAGRAADGGARRTAKAVLRAAGVHVLQRHLRRGVDHGTDGSERVCSLRVAWGCAGECTYCAIRFATGPLRSKPLNKVLEEFDAGLENGFRLFELIAGDVGCWGQDIGGSIVDLFDGVFRRSGDYRLIVDDFNPRWLARLRRELVPLVASNASRIQSFVVPTQSGSDRILSLMQRGYSATEVTAALVELRAAARGVQMITHVLVGFPGETDADFAATCDLLEAVRFDRVDAYPYAPRPNTVASRLPGSVPADVIAARCAALTERFSTVVADYL
jgi:tRNA A37 methylthiotransferase MiaB